MPMARGAWVSVRHRCGSCQKGLSGVGSPEAMRDASWRRQSCAEGWGREWTFRPVSLSCRRAYQHIYLVFSSLSRKPSDIVPRGLDAFGCMGRLWTACPLSAVHASRCAQARCWWSTTAIICGRGLGRCSYVRRREDCASISQMVSGREAEAGVVAVQQSSSVEC